MPMPGRKHTPETRERMAASKRGLTLSAETRAQIGLTRMGARAGLIGPMLDAYAADVPYKIIAYKFDIAEGSIGYHVRKARLAGDPRAASRSPRPKRPGRSPGAGACADVVGVSSPAASAVSALQVAGLHPRNMEDHLQ
jgi:hypothetical protein